MPIRTFSFWRRNQDDVQCRRLPVGSFHLLTSPFISVPFSKAGSHPFGPHKKDRTNDEADDRSDNKHARGDDQGRQLPVTGWHVVVCLKHAWRHTISNHTSGIASYTQKGLVCVTVTTFKQSYRPLWSVCFLFPSFHDRSSCWRQTSPPTVCSEQ